jgi:hypothetical protein
MTSGAKKTPAWLLERLALGELAPEHADEVRARLAAEGRLLGAELEAIERSNEEIRAALPKETVAASIRRRAAAQAKPRGAATRWSMFIAPLAVAGAVGAVVMVGRPVPTPGPAVTPGIGETDVEPTTIKGTPGPALRLVVYRQRPGGGGADRLINGARAARGDRLQLAYTLAQDGLHGVLLSIDGAGRVTLHLPEEGARQAAPLRSVREIKLPTSYELDDAPGFERFVLVVAPEPFPVESALAAARALARQGAAARLQPLPLSAGFLQTSVLLDKAAGGAP